MRESKIRINNHYKDLFMKEMYKFLQHYNIRTYLRGYIDRVSY
jgi:hypothetical protein